MQNKSKKPGNNPETNGEAPAIPNKDELTRKIEVLMGPDAEEAPPTLPKKAKSQTTAIPVQIHDDTDIPPPASAPELTQETATSEEPVAAEELPADDSEPDLDEATPVDTENAEKASQDAADEAEPKAEEEIEPVKPEEPAEPAEEDQESNEEPKPDEDEVVDDIVAKESDELLAAEDEKLAAVFAPKKVGFKDKIKHFFSAWWHNSRARKATIAGLIVLIFAVGAIPHSRYFVLNTIGVRASASLTVLDDGTQQPLKNVQVRLAGKTAVTDSKGQVKLERLKLGSSELVIEKRAFAPLTRKVTVGWGSNPLADYKLTPIGSQYSFMVTDFLSGKPVEKVEATSGDASAVSDNRGKLVLTIDTEQQQERDELKVSIKGESYRDEELTLNVNDKSEHRLKLVPSRKHAFISKRSGKYDVYKIDVDGKNEHMVFAGTGSERDDMTLVHHPTEDVVALVSTRENARNREGFLLSTLTVIDLHNDNNGDTRITQAERVQIVDWIDNRLVYVEVVAGTSAGNPKRHRLISYDYKEEDSKELAASNYFNDVTSAKGQIYYAPSAAYLNSGAAHFIRVNADGTGRQTIMQREVWNIFRTEYDKLNLSVQQEWYDYQLGSNATTQAKGPPAVLRTRIYVDSPNKERSLWVDDRDGKGVLIAYDTKDKKDNVLRSQSGLKNPMRWLNNKTVVYRINTDQETADYALNLDGGEPAKIRDVSNTGGVDQWYYY